MERRVAIIGAGISGLMACKYAIEKGFDPVVFEADSSIGGVWFSHCIESTRLQNARLAYRFSDFDWPLPPQGYDGVYPAHTEVFEYIKAYARNFRLMPHIRLNCRVTGIQYVGETDEEMEAWDQWGGTGAAFGSAGKWHVSVHNKGLDTIEVYQAEFVILCIGRFSGLPNIPKLPPELSIDRFHGKVMHAMDYSALDDSVAAQLVKGKRIAVIGSGKSALDIASECAEANGVEYPCTIILRSPRWTLPTFSVWGVNIALLYFNRFSELLVHKPGESFLHSFLATMLSPLRWGISKLAESYIRWKVPLNKYGMIPKQSFFKDMATSNILMLPENFYYKVEEGSIILKRSPKFGFVEKGITIEEEDHTIKSDLVILATGYRGDEKLVNLFESTIFREHIARSPNLTVPLYRQTIHPRIPRLATIGYSEGLLNMPMYEIRCRWLMEFLDGRFELPSIREMEKDVKAWEDHMKLYGGRKFWTSSIVVSNIWANDQLCKDMGCNPRRKNGFLAEWFEPYLSPDYAGITHNISSSTL